MVQKPKKSGLNMCARCLYQDSLRRTGLGKRGGERTYHIYLMGGKEAESLTLPTSDNPVAKVYI